MVIFFFHRTYLRLAEIPAEISVEFPLYLKVPSYWQSSCIVILISQSYHNHVEPQQHIIHCTCLFCIIINTHFMHYFIYLDSHDIFPLFISINSILPYLSLICWNKFFLSGFTYLLVFLILLSNKTRYWFHQHYEF